MRAARTKGRPAWSSMAWPTCPRGWNGPLAEWVARFEEWVDAPSPEALLHGAIFFDFRRVAGTLDLAPLEGVLGTAREKPAFVRFLARAALDFKPPPSLLLRLRGDAPAIDLKLHALAPIVHLARCYGIEARATGRGTLERLEAAARAGIADPAVVEAAADAFRFVLGLRLRLQLRRIAEGRHPNEGGATSPFNAAERGHLKDALRAIRHFQERAAFHYRTDF